MAEKESEIDLKKETAAALSYLLGPLTGIIFLILDKNPFVRFHAMQSIIVFASIFVVWVVLSITIILSRLVPLVFIMAFVLWLVLIYKAWLGEKWEAPIFGKYAKKMIDKI